MQDVRFDAAPLHAHAKALQPDIPQYRLTPVLGRPQRIDRALRDLGAHNPLLAFIDLRLGIT